jgi:hypothetical protein
MATNLMMVRERNSLVPADSFSAEALDAMKNGEVVRAVVTRPRNEKHHRKFFALLNVVFEAQDRYPTLDRLLHAIKIGVGLYELVPLTKTQTVIDVGSISFASMDQAEFTNFYDKVVKLIVTRILPGADSAELEARVLEILGGHQ